MRRQKFPPHSQSERWNIAQFSQTSAKISQNANLPIKWLICGFAFRLIFAGVLLNCAIFQRFEENKLAMKSLIKVFEIVF